MSYISYPGYNPRQVEQSFGKSGNSIENTVTGLDHKVHTWGAPLHWYDATCVQDSSIVTEKRDTFHKRSDLILRFVRDGAFKYAICYSPKIAGHGKAGKAGYPLKCGVCGTGHAWTVLWADKDGNYITHSGLDCFAEVIRGCGISNAEAIIEVAEKEKTKADKMRATMERINDFKADFPNLYENRAALTDRTRNPYARLWYPVLTRISKGQGVNEAWLEKCDNGSLDRDMLPKWKRNTTDESIIPKFYSRIPKHLLKCSEFLQSNGGNIDALLDALVKSSVKEDPNSIFYRDGAKARELAGITAQPTQPAQPAQEQGITINAPAAPPTPAIKADTDHIEDVWAKAEYVLKHGSEKTKGSFIFAYLAKEQDTEKRKKAAYGARGLIHMYYTQTQKLVSASI